MRNNVMVVLAGALFAGAAEGQATKLMVADIHNHKIILVSADDGYLANPYFITNDTGSAMQSPKEARVVGTQIIVSEGLGNALLRFSLDGTTYNGVLADSASSGITNLRGFEFYNGLIYLGVGSGTYAGKVVEVDLSGNVVGSFSTGPSPFDVQLIGDRLYVSDFSNNHVDMFSPEGSALGTFAQLTSSVPLDKPEQVVPMANGHVLIGAFGSTANGFYEYDSEGVLVKEYKTKSMGQGGIRAAYPLNNGNFLFTNGSGVWVYDVTSDTIFNTVSGNCNYITPLTCPADFNGDGFVDIYDFSDFVTCFEGGGCPPGATSDFNADGFSDIYDFSDFVTLYETGCP